MEKYEYFMEILPSDSYRHTLLENFIMWTENLKSQNDESWHLNKNNLERKVTCVYT